jgi:HK97 gp10 family phage protein
MQVKLSLSGVKEIDRVLKGLPLEMSHKVLGQAHADAAKPLVEKAKLLAPEGPTGNLVDSIGTEKENIQRATVIGQVQAGPRRSRRHKGHAGHLVEYGTRERKNKSGAGRGKMSKKPFMQPAFQATKEIIEKRIAESIGRKLYSFMKRILK